VVVHVAVVVVAAQLAGACVRRRERALVSVLTGLVVPLTPIHAYAAVSGMEVPLTSLLVLGAFLAALRARPRLAGVLLSAAILARPEALTCLPFVATVALLVQRTRATLSWRAPAVLVALALVGPALFGARNMLVSGRPLPATFYLKAHPFDPSTLLHDIGLGLHGLPSTMPPYGSAVVAVLLALALGSGMLAARGLVRLRRTTARALAGPIVAGAGALTALSWLVGVAVTSRLGVPDWFYFQRYVVPPLPLVVVASTVACAHLARFAAQGPRLARYRRLLPFAVVVPAAVLGGRALEALPKARATYERDVVTIDSVQVALGRLIAKNVSPGGVVWSQDAGAPRYFGGHKVVDLERLNNPELTAAEIPEALAPALVVVAPTIYKILSSPPDALELVAFAKSPREDAGEHAQQLAVRCKDGAVGSRIRLETRNGLVATGLCTHF
ncbi:MAG TPA: hypothetical protein VLT33_03820, partial [Labilithrix sp.]|nr:hypothetical protein [Labilithrix sp.]